MATKAKPISKKSSCCALCSQYYSDPRMLPCLHSFCHDCLVKRFKTKSSKHTCPTCKEAFEIPENKVDALPKDLHTSYVADVAEYEEMVKGKSSVNCDRCGDESNTLMFCCTCCKCLCNWCTKDHTKSLSTRKHELIDMGKNQGGRNLFNSIPRSVANCSVHSDEVLKFYCKTCSQLICCDCVVLSHSGHSYNRIEAVADSEKTTLLSIVKEGESAVGKLKNAVKKGQEVIQSVEAKKKLVDDEIIKCFKELQKVLKNHEENLLARNSEVGLEKVTALKLQAEEMEKLRMDIAQICERIKEASEVYTPAEILSAKGPMTDKFYLLLKRFNACSLDPCKNDSMITDFKSMQIKGDIEKFGLVSAGSCAASSTVPLYMPQAITGKEMKVVLTTRDVQGKPFGRGGEVVKATLQLIGQQNSGAVKGTVTDNKDGTYGISITTQSAGEHQLSITIGNEPIKSSPFVVSIRQYRNYRSLSGYQQYYGLNSQSWDLAITDNSELCILNYNGNNIQVENKQGANLRTIGGGNSTLQFKLPSAIAIRGDVMYVAEEGNNRIQKLTTSGEHIATFGSPGSGEGQLNGPRGIAIDPEGKIFVSEYNNNRVSVFGADGTFDHFITGNMNRPWGVAFDSTGNLHVVNNSNYTVSMFSPEGQYIRQYGNGNLTSPSGIAIDPEGYVFVGEYVEYVQPQQTYSSNYRRYNTQPVKQQGLRVFSPPNYGLYHTITTYKSTGVTLDKDGFVYICDTYNNRVVKY